MVNIHICNICKGKIYYRPEFYRTGNKFVKMNLDKTAHKCLGIEGKIDYTSQHYIFRKNMQDLEAVKNVCESEDKFDRAISEANKEYWNRKEEYQVGYDFPR